MSLKSANLLPHGWDTLREKQCEPDDFLAKPFDVFE
jgi:hypothetical protein